MNWGILGCGRIARKFAQGLRTLPEARLAAVASLTPDRAKTFAADFGVLKSYSNYEALVRDPDVDVVYVATLHNAHLSNMLLALDSGKHVLCEKPFTLNADQAQEAIDMARQKGLFLMEAMWTRFLPASRKIKKLVDRGLVGPVRCLRAEFGFRIPWNPEDRLHNRELAGGALLDLGIYPVSYARWIFGRAPKIVESSAHIGESGVDESSSYFFSYDEGETAQLFSSFKMRVPNEAVITGVEGYIRVPNFLHPRRFTLHKRMILPKLIVHPYRSTGLQYQAREVMICIKEGRTESAIMSLDETLDIMKILDRIRAPWGLKYPEEERP